MFAILTSGNVLYASAPNNSSSSGANIGGGLVPGRGNTAYDVTVLEIGLRPPVGAHCLRLDFAFYSEEYPEWVGSAYNDGFVAELDQSTWTTNNRSISAPDNFAFDDRGNVISINSTGVTSMSDLNSAGTTYDGATVLLQAATLLAPNTDHKLYLSIFDQGDHVLDSAVFVDNIRLESVSNPEINCIPGATSKTRIPVILLPGVGGTKLNNHTGELWPRIGELLISSSDDFLLPLRLDATGTGPLYPNNPDYSTVAAGDILEKVLTQDFYGHAIETLELAGYQRNVDLFPFPYDWRQDIDTLANELLARIDEIREQTGAERVDIIGHSMGGLITRAALANPNSIGKVRKVVTLGSPALGAPKILGMLEYQTPCFLEMLGCRVNPSTLQDILTNLISAYQILPGPAYDIAHMAPVNIDRDTNGDGLPEGLQDYAKWTAIVSAHRNSALLQKNAPFHQAYDNLTLADPSVQFYRVVGDQMNTMVQIREYIKCLIWNFNCCVEYELIMGNGDGTVPLHSADLYNPAAGIDYRAGVPNAYAHEVEHGVLAGNDDVLKFILSFLGTAPSTAFGPVSAAGTPLLSSAPEERQEQDPIAPQPLGLSAVPLVTSQTIAGLSDSPEPFGGIELETVGPVEGFIQDEASNLLGPDMIVEAIPGGTYNAIGNTQSFFLNQDGHYQARLNVVGADPVTLRVRTYANDAMSGQAVFNVSAPIHAGLQVAFATEGDLGALQLQVDVNADGVFDEVIPPDSFYTGPIASETIPPKTTATIHWAAPQITEVTLTAEDQPGGAGVAHTYYRILNEPGSESMIYTAPFTIPLGAELQFFSDDRVGNTEQIQAIQTVLLDIKPGSFPNSLNLGANGTTPSAILSTPTFDATAVDISTITLAGAPVATKNNGAWMISFEDVNRDGRLDLVFHVTTSKLHLDSTSTEAFLYAQTQSGTPLISVDTVRTVH